MTAALLPPGKQTFFDSNGRPLAGGSIYFYIPNTSTFKSTWQDAGETVLNTNPVILDSNGEAIIYGDGQYRQVVYDVHGNLIWDQLTASPALSSDLQSFITSLAAPGGVAKVGSAAWYAPNVIGINTTNIPDGATVICAGRGVPNDGGGGVFTFVKSSTQTADNGLVFAPIGGGRLFRQGWSVVGFNGALSPLFFGAKGDGTTDDAVALQAIVTAAFTPGVEQEITLAGGTFLTNTPISYPAGGYVNLISGTIKAGSSFPLGRHVVEATNQSGGLVHHDLRFRDVTFDGSHRGGGLHLDNYIRVVVDSCNAFHFPTSGFWLSKTIDSHECMFVKCYSFEYLYNESGYLTPTPTSVGFQIDSFDNHLIGVVSYYTGIGITVNGQYNLIHQAHVGGATWAIRITQLAAFTSIVQPYIDSAAVSWENPWNSEIVDGKFLHNTADATFSFIVLKPLGANLALSGLKVTNCSFHNSGAALVDSITTDTSGGGFNNGQIINCHMYGNSFANVKQKGTRVRKSLFQTAATVWTFNFDNDLAFGVVQWLQDSYYDATGGAPVSRVTNISGNTVTVTNSVAGNGTVFIEVDVNTGTS
jgi:hypothetical protein